MRKLMGVAVAIALVMALAGTALAAKGGNGKNQSNGGGHHGNGSVSITVPDGVFGQADTATTSAGLYVYATCSQNGTVVYTQYSLADASGNAALQLGPTPLWTGGSAACTATAGSFSNTGKWSSQASTTFSVSG